MHLDQVRKRFTALTSTVYLLNAGACETELRETENRLSLQFPAPVRTFWTFMNGLSVDDPPFEVLPLSKFSVDAGALVFARCNAEVRVAFDTRVANEAGEWSVINADTGYRITYTMASFWSVHMWTWILKRRPIWFDVHSIDSALNRR